ncbi:hypothetical protein HN451_03450, partial [archaeon]|nr:hypothetical protein [archaeon]
MKIKRIPSGINGFDNMVQGGLPTQSIIGLKGPAGVGKSIFAMQFLLQGAKNNEKSVYINLEEPRTNIDRTLDSMSFGKEFFDFEEKGLIKIICLNFSEFEKVYPTLLEKISKDKKIKRLVVDSFNCFFSYLNFDKSEKVNYEIRKILSQSFYSFRKKDMTTLLLLENGSSHNSQLNHYVSYMVDGLIH